MKLTYLFVVTAALILAGCGSMTERPADSNSASGDVKNQSATDTEDSAEEEASEVTADSSEVISESSLAEESSEVTESKSDTSEESKADGKVGLFSGGLDDDGRGPDENHFGLEVGFAPGIWWSFCDSGDRYYEFSTDGTGMRAYQADGFKEGDVLYFKVENPSNWAQDATLYVNFTDASRTDNGGVSVIIADADKTKYNPVTGVSYDSAKSAYKYTVTAADAGASVMRFWRGNAEKLWNETVAITADDYAKGLDTAVVTDWSDTGYLTSSSGNAPATEAQTDPEPVTDANITAETANALYAYAGTGEDTEAWVKWYKVDDTYYFFLPSSV